MIKVVQINMTGFGSTGNIIASVAEIAKSNDIKTVCAYPGDTKVNPDDYLICSRFFHKAFQKLYEYTGLDGHFSYFHTKKFIRFLKKFNPDIIQLHNLHSNYINLKLLFKYLKKSKVKVFWTLHDCWSFTGRCSHFQMSGCEKWKNGCYDCGCKLEDYPHTRINAVKYLWNKKKKLFCGIKDMTVITPSSWLASLAKESYLGKYPIKVINNGIDLSVFKPRENDVKKRYGIEDKFLVLGVAQGWASYKKGRDVFEKLVGVLDDRYRVLMVGTDKMLDAMLPKEIIKVHRTWDRVQLAEIYSAADVFVNPTREETFPTVNIEALACGTPVITFNTGGSPEIIDENCGIVIENDDMDSLVKSIIDVCENKRFSKENCVNRAKRFNKHDRFAEYLRSYN